MSVTNLPTGLRGGNIAQRGNVIEHLPEWPSANWTVLSLGDENHTTIYTVLTDEVPFFAGLTTADVFIFSTRIAYSFGHISPF